MGTGTVLHELNKKSTVPVPVLHLMRSAGLEPAWSPIRPSNVRVCQFHHDRVLPTANIILSPYTTVKVCVITISHIIYIGHPDYEWAGAGGRVVTQQLRVRAARAPDEIFQRIGYSYAVFRRGDKLLHCGDAPGWGGGPDYRRLYYFIQPFRRYHRHHSHSAWDSLRIGGCRPEPIIQRPAASGGERHRYAGAL